MLPLHGWKMQRCFSQTTWKEGSNAWHVSRDGHRSVRGMDIVWVGVRKHDFVLRVGANELWESWPTEGDVTLHVFRGAAYLTACDYPTGWNSETRRMDEGDIASLGRGMRYRLVGGLCGVEAYGTCAAPATDRVDHVPYIATLGVRDGAKVYVVDGGWVRRELDIEFTNFGVHGRHPFIPPDEVWIDVADNLDDFAFYVTNAALVCARQLTGVPYETALAQAAEAEVTERVMAGDATNANANADVRLALIGHAADGVSVWMVSGRLVRSRMYLDFTMGGHDLVYAFIPQREVWIDDDVTPFEREYVLAHELHERHTMARGADYATAHPMASFLELDMRRHPGSSSQVLTSLGWTPPFHT